MRGQSNTKKPKIDQREKAMDEELGPKEEENYASDEDTDAEEPDVWAMAKQEAMAKSCLFFEDLESKAKGYIRR